MRVHDLRLILLIQAIEESDTKGELLPLAEREEATQEMVRGAGDVDEAFAGDALSPTGERLLTRRAQHLHERVRLRAPITDRLLAVIVGAARWALGARAPLGRGARSARWGAAPIRSSCCKSATLVDRPPHGGACICRSLCAPYAACNGRRERRQPALFTVTKRSHSRTRAASA